MSSSSELTPDESSQPQRLRIAIVCRRFWPYAGSTEFAIADLASAIRRSGHDVEIITIRWEKNWPARFEFRELRVHRINRPPTGPWGTFRYLRNLNRYLNELRPDGIILFGLNDEAGSIAKSMSDTIPLVIRIDNHLLGFRDGKAHLSQRQLAALNSARRVIVESQWTAERMLENPSLRQELTIVPDGVTIDSDHCRTRARQGSSRVAISDAHPMLMVDSAQPLVICGAPMNGDQGLIDLIKAWPRVIKRFPTAKLWIFGEGKQGHLIWNTIQDDHLVHSVIMPGSFDHLVEILLAADVYVHPLRSNEMCGFLNRALVSGVCCISTDTTATPIEDEINGLLVPPNAPSVMSQAIIRSLESPDLRDRLGRAASKTMSDRFAIDNMVHHYLNPIAESAQQTVGSTDEQQVSNLSS